MVYKLAALLVAVSSTVAAQRSTTKNTGTADDGGYLRLMTAKTIACTFSSGSITTMRHDGLETVKDKMETPSVFKDIDTARATATVVGRFGEAKAIVNLGLGSLVFIELTDTGNVVTTSVFPIARNGVSTNDYIAVHSRHISGVPRIQEEGS